MTDDEMKLIAEAHGWSGSSTGIYLTPGRDAFGNFNVNGGVDITLAYADENEEWHLTPAGAWKVLVANRLCLETDVNRAGDWGCLYHFAEDKNDHDGWAIDDNPIHAVEQAELARLRGV